MSMTSTSETPRVVPGDWEAPESPYPARDRLALLALIAIPASLVVLVIAFLTGVWWIAVLLLGLWLGKTIAEARWRDPVMLRRLGARPLPAGDAQRLENIVTGLSADLGVAAPDLYLMDRPGPNALVASGGRNGILAVTPSMLEGFTRTELEAVVAHSLLRMRSKTFVYSNLAARWSDLGAGLAPRVGASDDVRACALTRFPPALAAAIEKCDARIERYAPLWFASEAPSHEPAAARIALLKDL
jgi:hypothetical protein